MADDRTLDRVQVCIRCAIDAKGPRPKWGLRHGSGHLHEATLEEWRYSRWQTQLSLAGILVFADLSNDAHLVHEWVCGILLGHYCMYDCAVVSSRYNIFRRIRCINDPRHSRGYMFHEITLSVLTD